MVAVVVVEDRAMYLDMPAQMEALGTEVIVAVAVAAALEVYLAMEGLREMERVPAQMAQMAEQAAAVLITAATAATAEMQDFQTKMVAAAVAVAYAQVVVVVVVHVFPAQLLRQMLEHRVKAALQTHPCAPAAVDKLILAPLTFHPWLAHQFQSLLARAKVLPA